MPPIPETVLFKMIDLTTGLPWSKASTLKETISAKEAFWKKYCMFASFDYRAYSDTGRVQVKNGRTN